jgi:hypothetical protein
MFIKLFKYDFRSISRWFVPLMIGIGGAAVIGFFNTLILGLADGSDEGQTYSKEVMTAASTGGVAIIAVVLTIAATAAALLLFVKFYKTMVTDEAYLTFTLPVTAGQLIGAKFLSAVVWSLIVGCALCAAWCVFFSGVMITAGESFREGIFLMVKELLEEIGDDIGSFLLLILYALIRAVRAWFQITCAILFGASIVRRNKALVAVLMVLAVNFAVNTILSLFGVSGLIPAFFGMMLGDGLFAGDAAYEFNTVLWILIAVNAVLIAAFWLWNWWIAKKSVNIE